MRRQAAEARLRDSMTLKAGIEALIAEDALVGCNRGPRGTESCERTRRTLVVMVSAERAGGERRELLPIPVNSYPRATSDRCNINNLFACRTARRCQVPERGTPRRNLATHGYDSKVPPRPTEQLTRPGHSRCLPSLIDNIAAQPRAPPLLPSNTATC